jgi:NAD-dependent SIR2 family protein deacetylase
MAPGDDMSGNQPLPPAVDKAHGFMAAMACPACHGELTHLGDLAASLRQPALRIWRCYTCDNVISEPRG